MTRTIVASETKEHVIGFDQPFTIIGERINPTNRPKFAAELEQGIFDTVKRDAIRQTEAGAHILDVNAGIAAVDPNETEPPLLRAAVEAVQEVSDLPLCIDSSVTGALAAALEVAKGRPLVNSVTGEEEKLEGVLPLVKKHDVPVVAICNDESGISEDPEVRFAVAKKIVQRAADHGIAAHDIVVDPLVLPIGAVNTAGVQVFQLVRRLREELGVNTTCGASNIGFGMPNRRVLTAYFIATAASHGMTSAIMNPLHEEDMTAVLAADLLNGHDPDSRKWTAKFRAPAPEGAEGEGGRRGRRGGRRRRRG